MPVSLVLVLPELQSIEALSRSLQQQTGAVPTPWSMTATLYRPSALLAAAPVLGTPSAGAAPQDSASTSPLAASARPPARSLYHLAFSDGRPDAAHVEPNISATVKGTRLDVLLTRLRNLWTVRQTLKCTGASFQISGLTILAGNLTIGSSAGQGVLIEVIYHDATPQTGDTYRALFNDLLATYVDPTLKSTSTKPTAGSTTDTAVGQGVLGDYPEAYIGALAL
ncbi:hypothetical protein RI367_002980 [Sorochytrium milnesiophthora]